MGYLKVHIWVLKESCAVIRGEAQDMIRFRRKVQKKLINQDKSLHRGINYTKYKRKQDI